MPWPLSQDYNEAIQNPRTSFADSELAGGSASVNALGMPMPRSGNFADVYEVTGASGAKWAVKCFTREVPGLQERYNQINLHLLKAKLPFTVDFQYQQGGIRIRGQWYPIVKMHWVEGQLLNEFVRHNLDKPKILDGLAVIWAKMSRWLRDADMAHADLQHGNVILVPGSKSTSLAVKLIDYDGMFVPALAKIRSGELGHPAYQHPERAKKSIYSPEVDRLPLLAVACALRGLGVGGKALWDKYDNGDNMLFRATDLANPGQSAVMRDLWNLPDEGLHDLVGYLALALTGPLDQTPLLHEVMQETRIQPMSAAQEKAAQAILGGGAKVVRAAPPPRPVQKAEAVAPVASDPWTALDEPEPAVKRREKPRSKAPVWIGLGSAAAVLLIGVVVLIAALGGGRNDSTKDKTVQRDSDSSTKDTKDVDKKDKDKRDKDSGTIIPNKDKDGDPKKDGKVETPIDAGSLAKFAGYYHLAWQGPPVGQGRFFLTKFGETMIDGDPHGTWRVENGKVVLNLDQPNFKRAVLEPKEDGVLIGQGHGMDDKEYNWLLKRERVLAPFQSVGKATLIYLSQLKEESVVAFNNSFRKNGTMPGEKDWPIEIDGSGMRQSLFFQPHPQGIGAVTYALDKEYDYFLADVTMPQGVKSKQANPRNPVTFEVLANGTSVWRSQPQARCGQVERCKVSLKGAKKLELRVYCENETDFCLPVWIQPRLAASAAVVEIPSAPNFHPAGEIVEATPDWIDRVACSADGHFAVYSTQKRDVVVWDLPGKKALHRRDDWKKNTVNVVLVSPDGKYFGVGGGQKNFTLLHVDSGKQYRAFLPNSTVYAASMSADGRFLVLGTGTVVGKAEYSDCYVFLYDVAKGALLKKFEGHDKPVRQVGFAKDGNIISMANDFTVRIWDPETGQAVARIELPLGNERLDRVRTLVPERGEVLFLDKDRKSIIVWDLDKKAEARKYPPALLEILDIHVAPGGQLAVLTVDKGLLGFGLAEGKVLGQFPEVGERVFAIAFTADGKTMFSGGRDKAFRKWRLTETAPAEVAGVKLKLEQKWQTSYCDKIAFLPDGKRFVGANTGLDILQIGEGKPLSSIEVKSPSARKYFHSTLAILSGGKQALVSNMGENDLHIVDLESGQEEGVLPGEADVTALAVSADEKNALAAYVGGKLILWNLETRKPIRESDNVKLRATCLALTPDGKRALVGWSHGKIVVLDVETPARVTMATGLDAGSATNCAAISPDGRLGAVGTNTGGIVLVDMNTIKIIDTLAADKLAVDSLLFAKNGNLLVSGNTKGVIRLWDVAARKELSTEKGHGFRTCGLALSPSGEYILSASPDNNVCLWRLVETASVPDNDVLAKAPGRYKLFIAEQPKRKSYWEFTKTGRAIQDGNDMGDWRIDGQTVVITYSPTYKHFGFARLTFKDDATLVGKNEHTTGQVFNWVLTREAADLKPSPQASGLKLEESWKAPHFDKIAILPDGKSFVGLDQNLQIWPIGGDKATSSFEVKAGPRKEFAFGTLAILHEGKQALCSLPGENDLHLVSLETGQEEAALPGPSTVESLAVSADEKRALAGYRDGKFILWDLEAKKSLKENLIFRAPVKCVAISADRTRAVVGWQDGEILVCTLNNLTPVGKGAALKADTPLSCAAGSPDGVLAAVGTSGGEILLIDTRNAEITGKLFAGKKHIDAILFAQKGRVLVFGNTEGFVRVWDVANRKELSNQQGHGFRISALALAPEEDFVLSAGPDKKMCRWRFAASAEVAPKVPKLEVGPSPLDKLDPANIAAGDRPKQTIKDLVAVLSGGHKKEIFGVTVSPSGKLVASCGDDGLVCVWDLTGTVPKLRGTMSAGGPLSGVAFSPDSERLAFATPSTVFVYDITGAEPKKQVEENTNSTRFPGVAYAPDGKSLAVSSNDGALLLDMTKSPPEVQSTCKGHKGSVRTVAFNKEGTKLVTAGEDGTCRIYDLTANPPKELADLQGDGHFWQAAFSPDGTRVAAGTGKGTVFCWDITGKKPELLWSKDGHRQWANSVAFAPDGKTLASTGGGGSPVGPHLAVWWNAADGSILKQWELPERSSQCAFAPSGLYLAVTCHNRKLYILKLGE